MFVTVEVSTDEAPRMMNSVASVTMNDGSPVRTTMRPLITPRKVVATIAMMIDSQTGRPQIVTPMPMTIPAKPTMRADRQVELAGDHQQSDGRGRRCRPGPRRRGS